MDRIGISARSTGSLQIVPSEKLPASIVIRTASFSIFMYLEMTRIISFFIAVIISGEHPALSERSRRVSRSFAVSLEHRSLTFHLSILDSFARMPVVSPGDSIGTFCPKRRRHTFK